MNDNLKIIIKAMLAKNSLSDIKKQLARQKFNVNVNVSMNQLSKSLSGIEKQTSDIGKNIKKLTDNSTFEKQIKQWSMQSNQILSIIRQISDAVTSTSDSGENLESCFEDTITDLGSLLTESDELTNIFSNAISYAGRMADTIYELNNSMIHLYRITNETDTKYEEFLSSANKSAQKLGNTVTDFIDQTAQWAEQGYNLDDSNILTKASSIYSNISGVDNSTAISDISAAMQAFNIEASDSITIVDKLSKLGDEFSTSTADIGTGLNIAASDLQSAGNSIDETLALIAGSSEKIGDASDTGNTLKIFSMRIRGMKKQLMEMGEDTTNVYSQAGIRKNISFLTDNSVDIFDSSGNMKSSYKILKDVSNIYEKLSKTKQVNLLQALFGTERAGQGESIIKAFQSGKIEKAYNSSTNAADSAYGQQSKWMQTLTAKTKQFEAAFQSLSQSMMDSDMLKWFIDFGTGAINSLSSVVEKIGSLPTIMAGVGAVLGAKNHGRLKVSLNIHC